MASGPEAPLTASIQWFRLRRGTRDRFGRFQHMSEVHDIREIVAPPLNIEETNRLFRLTPATVDLARAGRQMALVPDDTEDEARRTATLAADGSRPARHVAISLRKSGDPPSGISLGNSSSSGTQLDRGEGTS
jgi:hypothetical protein